MQLQLCWEKQLAQVLSAAPCVYMYRMRGGGVGWGEGEGGGEVR